jgi:hypothetical protein
MDWLDDQEFYEAMQAYRHAPITDPAAVVAAFEAVKAMIRENTPEIDEWPDSIPDPL